MNTQPIQTHPSGDLTIQWPKQGEAAARFIARHEEFCRRAQVGGIDLLFLGDSITEQWDTVPELWASRYVHRRAANFGISGDGVQHVLWRIQHGELLGFAPKVIVLLIGTNNTRDASGEAIASGVAGVVAEIRRRVPLTKVLLLGIFPRGPGMNADGTSDDGIARRRIIRTANTRLRMLDDGAAVRFLDLEEKFLPTNDAIPRELMPDQLHLSPRGYAVWADGMESLLCEMLGEAYRQTFPLRQE